MKNRTKHSTRPTPHPVVFRDQSAGVRYLSRSTRTSHLSTTWEDGNIYPVIEVDLSSAAHHARQAERETVGAGRR
ncbi:50S ribosomal protein L31 [Brachybacterium sp. YJGR34]|uniref:50S ribosomal protein L31 n=1 Tax=Brachybacterium sp. YJGR34 TaxID=2059911 RepID=UPI000E0BB555|nr:50S ribosomal protein L31 [Brachybacterium sp. YJGR34]